MPNLKKIGLLHDELIPEYEKLGVMGYADGDNDYETLNESWRYATSSITSPWTNIFSFLQGFSSATVSYMGDMLTAYTNLDPNNYYQTEESTSTSRWEKLSRDDNGIFQDSFG